MCDKHVSCQKAVLNLRVFAACYKKEKVCFQETVSFQVRLEREHVWDSLPCFNKNLKKNARLCTVHIKTALGQHVGGLCLVHYRLSSFSAHVLH